MIPSEACFPVCTSGSSRPQQVTGNLGQAALVLGADDEANVPSGPPVATGRLPSQLSNADIKALEQAYADKSRILNIGSGNQPVRGAVNLDIQPGKGVNVPGDALNLPFKEGSFNRVTATNIPSELAGRYGNQLAAEAYKVLKPGGTIDLSSRTGFSPAVLDTFKSAGFRNVTIEGNTLRAIK